MDNISEQTSRVVVFNKYCRLNETNIELIRNLDSELSYIEEGTQYLRSFRGFFDRDGKWIQNTGKKSLLTDKLEFPRGLLERVKKFYELSGKTLEIVDQRTNKTKNIPIDISKKLLDMGKVPRDHQVRAVECTRNTDLGILALSVSAGKTLISAMITAEQNTTTCVFVIGITLLEQFYELYCEIFGKENVGYIGNGVCIIKKINIVSIWSAHASIGGKKSFDDFDDKEKKLDKEKYHEIRKLLSETKLVILDECHVSRSATVSDLNAALVNAENSFFLSATPYSGTSEDLLIESICGPTLIHITPSELIKAGLITRPYIRYIPVPLKEPSSGAYQTVYKECIVENEERNNLILKGCKSLYAAGYKNILIFFSSITHGDLLYELISKEMSCAILSGKDDLEKRKEVIEKFEKGETSVLLGSKILNIGVSIECIDGMIIADAGKSFINLNQKIGRGCRLYPGKKRVQVIDFIDPQKILLSHSKERRRILKQEEEFIVEWPKTKKKL